MSNCANTKSGPEWAYAHLILRLWVGSRLLLAGLDKMREKGGDKGFGFQWIGESMKPIVATMSDNVGPWMPAWSIKLYAGVLPYALLVTGLWIILGFANVPGRMAATASALYAKNLFTFVETMINKTDKTLAINWDDELVKATLLTRDGAIVHPNFQTKA